MAILAPLHAADTPATPATTRPATSRPATTQPVKPDPKTMSSDQMLGQMLRPATPSQPKPLQPLVDVPTTDKTSAQVP